MLTQAAIWAYGRFLGVNVRFKDGVISFQRGHKEIRIAAANFPYAQDMIIHYDAYYGAVFPNAQGVVDY